MARQYLTSVYGDEVEIEYFDASVPDVRAQFAAVAKDAEARRLSYPLILMNDEIKTSGGVSAYQLMYLVDQDRKEKGLPARF